MSELESQEWSPAKLHRQLRRGGPFFVFDVRNEEEFERSRIEGREPLPAANVPYFEMLEAVDSDDLVGSFAAFLSQEWAAKLPRELPILAVCAKGDTSAYVAEALRRLGFDAANLVGGTSAWGDHYGVEAIFESERLTVHQIVRPARGCLSYFLSSHRQGAVVDPLRHVEVYERLAAQLGVDVELVIDTHGHADHISGGRRLADRTGAAYLLHPYDAIHPIDVLPATIEYEPLRGGQRLELGPIGIELLHIPGHTLGNLACRVDERYLLTGDSIFIGSIARPDLGGRGDTWAPLHYRSLRRLLELPDDTLVLPGHFATLAEAGERGLFSAPLGTLRETNRDLALAAGSEDEFVRHLLASLPELPDEYVEIKRVNAGLSVPSENEASELELGKNVCALAAA